MTKHSKWSKADEAKNPEPLTSVAQDWTPPSTVTTTTTVTTGSMWDTGEPKFLGDFTVNDNIATEGVTRIAWASEDGIRRVEIPSWLFARLRK